MNEYLQLSLRHGELRRSAVQADFHIRKQPNDGFVGPIQPGEVYRDLTTERFTGGLATMTEHKKPLCGLG